LIIVICYLIYDNIFIMCVCVCVTHVQKINTKRKKEKQVRAEAMSSPSPTLYGMHHCPPPSNPIGGGRSPLV